jgi:hypothetical protein
MKNLIVLAFLLLSFSVKSQTIFKTYKHCYFEVSLPTTFKLSREFDDGCDYVASLRGKQYVEIHSSELGRFELSTLDEFYAAAVKNRSINITYKTKGTNWFVISGIDVETKNLIYWKRIITRNYVSDLRFEYPSSAKNDIEMHIGKIAASFKSQ